MRKAVLERRQAIMLTLYFNKGWTTSTQIAAALKLKVTTIGSLLKRMADADEIQIKTEIRREKRQLTRRYFYKLSDNARRYWGRQLMKAGRASDGESKSEGVGR